MTREQRRRAIVRAYARGEPVAAIGRRFGVTDAAVVQCARRAGEPARNAGLSKRMQEMPRRPTVRSAPHDSVAKSYVHPALSAKESPLLDGMRSDPEYVEIAPRQFVSAANFMRYKREAGWRDISGRANR